MRTNAELYDVDLYAPPRCGPPRTLGEISRELRATSCLLCWRRAGCTPHGCWGVLRSASS